MMSGTRGEAGAATDPLSQLLAIVSDPQATEARIVEIQNAMASMIAAQQSLDGLAKKLDEREQVLTAKAEELDKHEADIAFAREGLDKREADLTRKIKLADEQDSEMLAGYAKKDGELAEAFANLAAKRHEIEQRERTVVEQEKLAAQVRWTLEDRESKLNALEHKIAKEQADLESRIAAMKALIA